MITSACIYPPNFQTANSRSSVWILVLHGTLLTSNATELNSELGKTKYFVRIPDHIKTGTNILKLDPGFYSYEDSNASNSDKLAMGFPSPIWNAAIYVSGYWSDSSKTFGYINIFVIDCNSDIGTIYYKLCAWGSWKAWKKLSMSEISAEA